MATLKVKLPDDLMAGLERLSKQADAVVEKTLEAGAEMVEDKVRSNLKNVIGTTDGRANIKTYETNIKTDLINAGFDVSCFDDSDSDDAYARVVYELEWGEVV